jgi:hypothetical protein
MHHALGNNQFPRLSCISYAYPHRAVLLFDIAREPATVMNRPESPSNDALVSLISLVSRRVSAVLALGLLGLVLAIVLLLVLAFVWVPLPATSSRQ